MRTDRYGRAPRLRLGIALAIALLFAMTPSAVHAQFGVAISGVGPINRSMGGAAVAAPLDSAGALYWNPATIGALEFRDGVRNRDPDPQNHDHLVGSAGRSATGCRPNAMQGYDRRQQRRVSPAGLRACITPRIPPGRSVSGSSRSAVSPSITRSSTTNPILNPGCLSITASGRSIPSSSSSSSARRRP